MTTEGRKIDTDVENPIDNLIIRHICEPVSTILRNISEKITPNMITTVGLVLGLACVYAIYNGNYKTAFVLYWVSYILDCLDGYYARKYKMMSKFGDYYDHVRDMTVNIAVVILIYMRLKTQPLKDLYLVSLIIITIGLFTHFGAQELNSVSPEHNDCLGMLTPLCKHRDYIGYTRYMGNGTFILIISLFILKL